MKVNIFNIQSYKYNVEPQTFIDDWQKGLGPDTPEAKKLSVPEFMHLGHIRRLGEREVQERVFKQEFAVYQAEYSAFLPYKGFSFAHTKSVKERYVHEATRFFGLLV